MVKSSKIFKNLLGVIIGLKSPSKAKSTTTHDDTEQQRKTSKEKCRWSLGKSFSRKCDVESTISLVLPDVNTTRQQIVEQQATQPEYIPKEIKSTIEDGVDVSLCKGIITNDSNDSSMKKGDEQASIQIQTAFRGYLARRALQTLKALIRLQSLVRGCIVRRRAAAALRSIEALVRLQAHIRAYLVRRSAKGQMAQKKLSQRKLLTKEKWTNSSSISRLQDAWNSNNSSSSSSNARLEVKNLREIYPDPRCVQWRIDHPANDSWGWLERWTTAKPWLPSSPAPSSAIIKCVLKMPNRKLLVLSDDGTIMSSVNPFSSQIQTTPPTLLPRISVSQETSIVPTSICPYLSCSSLSTSLYSLQDMTWPTTDQQTLSQSPQLITQPQCHSPSCLFDAQRLPSSHDGCPSKAVSRMISDGVTGDLEEQHQLSVCEVESEALSLQRGDTEDIPSICSRPSPKRSSKHQRKSGTGNIPKMLIEQENSVASSSPVASGYMATTQSSKAKTRAQGSPKQKQEIQSPSKRLQSLSGTERKGSPAAQRNVSYHARAASKGNFPSLKDGNIDTNGGSGMHVN